MSVTVYIWKYISVNSVGHASLSLSEGTHISWWPEEDMKRLPSGHAEKASAVEDQTLKADKYLEDREPDEVISLDSGKLNEKKIIEWWKDFKKSERWKLTTNNCSTVVYQALKEGGALDYLTRRDWYNPNFWTPNRVLQFVRLLEECMRSPKDVCEKLEGKFIENFKTY